MDRLVAALLAATAAALVVCALAVAGVVPDRPAEAVLLAAGPACAAFVWTVGGPRSARLRGWRLVAPAPLFPVAGALVGELLEPFGPAGLVPLVLTVPGYVLAVIGALTLAGRGALRAQRARTGVELALFGTACLVAVQVLFVGSDGAWEDLTAEQRLVLGAAVAATAATTAAALGAVTLVEPRRQAMALVLLGGVVLSTAGHGLDASGVLGVADGTVALGRLAVVAGLALISLAALVDPGLRPESAGMPETARSTPLGQLLPHLAMVLAMGVAGLATLLGSRPGPLAVAGVVACAVLAAAHRWVAARDERRMADRLRRSESYFRSLVRSTGDAVLILDGDLRVGWASPSLARTLGEAAQAVPGRDLAALVHPEDVPAVTRALGAEPDGDRACALLLFRLRHADGTWRDLEASVSDLRRDADVGAVVLTCRDVTTRLHRERALEQVAFTDPLTGLPNRAGCAGAVGRILDTDEAAEWSLLLVELDGLEEVRENAGREVVSAVLVEVGRRLRATVRASEPVARVGSDAFAVLARSAGCTVDLLASRCLSVLEQPFVTAAGIFDLTATVGVAELEAGHGVGEVLARAELAVRAAAASGPGTARRYRPALGEAAARRARLREDLPGAAARGELSVLFQPVVSLELQRVTGVEALLRWRHPELGDVPPTEFVPIAERAGVIGEVQLWALELAAAAAVGLPEGEFPLRLGVNISASHVTARTLVGDVASVLSRTGLAPERLVLEITEATVLTDAEHVAVDMEALRLMGVHVALDDFGTGQSSLTHLTRLPIDVLKLDQSFVSRVDRDRTARALCESVLTVGRSLGLDVVAEGVETPAQLNVLRGLGCGFAQGFLLARPLPLGELTELLEDGAGLLWPGLVGSR